MNILNSNFTFLISILINTTSDNVTVDGGLSPVNPSVNNTTDVVKIVNSIVGSELEKRDIIIQNQDLRIKKLENSSAEKDVIEMQCQLKNVFRL